MLSWGGATAFKEGLNLPGKIISLGDYLVVLNKDGSLGFWNKQGGNEAFTIFLFQDDSWIALYPNGRFASSQGGERHLSLYDGSSATRLNKEAFRASGKGEGRKEPR